MAQTVKNLPAMQETWIRSLGWEDPLEKGRVPTPVFLPGESHGQTSLVPSRVGLSSPGIISKRGGFRAPDGDSAGS